MSYKPKHIVIAGIKYDIVYKEMKEFGELDSDGKKIAISKKIKGEVLLDTLVHEAFHAMLDISGLGYILEDVQPELEEALVRAYDHILTPLVKELYKDFYKK